MYPGFSQFKEMTMLRSRVDRSLIFCVALVLCALCPPASGQGFASPEQIAQLTLRRLLSEQAEAWNRGDLEGFCSVYADDVAFLTPKGMTRGRKEVLARYRERYPDAASRGHLSLEVVEIRLATWEQDPPTSTDASVDVRGASIVARWKIEFPDSPGKEPASGLTLLVLHPDDGSWKIQQDASM